MFQMGLSVLSAQKRVSHLPFAIKIDTTPNCQLKCIVCIHGNSPMSFKDKNMSLALFEKILEEVDGITSAFSLYYLGEPFINKDTIKMVELASRKRITTFVSSNFSFNFGREEIKRIADSGLTSLTVCLDGMTQDIYERTRVKGRVDYIINNLKYLQQYKAENNRKFPFIEVQFLKYPHNEHEIPEIKKLALSLGLDQLNICNGTVVPWLEGGAEPEKVLNHGRKRFY